ncbi:MAG: hypothetical protein JNN12_00965 [Bacteroidetes Order II. Incertae sedis bacterium]|nr:hypothetical protein [Bacteroidetes Order II. bacterium]
MYKYLLLLFVLPAGLQAQDCTEPEWFRTTPKMEGWLIEPGMGESKDPHWAKDRAVGRARTEIAQTVNLWVEAVEREVFTDDPKSNEVRSVFKSVSEQYTSTALNETQILKATLPCTMGGHYRVYALVAYPHKINFLKDLGYNVERNDQDLWNRLQVERPLPRVAPPAVAKPLYQVREPKNNKVKPNQRNVSGPARRTSALRQIRQSPAVKRIVMEVDGIRTSDLKFQSN